MQILLIFVINAVNPGFDFLRINNIPVQVDGLNGVWYNPAQLVMPGKFVGFNYTSWFLDEGIYSIYAKNERWGIRFRYFNMGEVEFQGERPRDDLMLKFNPYAFELGVSRGFRIDDETAAGIGATAFFSRLYSSESMGYALSAGLLYRPHRLPGLSLSAFIKNFGFKRTYRGYPINVPTEIGFMAQYNFKNRAVVGYWFQKAGTFKADSVENGVANTHTIYGKIYFHSLEISAAYEVGQTVVPLTVGLSYSVKNRFRFFYLYRHGFYGFNSPFITGVQMEF